MQWFPVYYFLGEKKSRTWKIQILEFLIHCKFIFLSFIFLSFISVFDALKEMMIFCVLLVYWLLCKITRVWYHGVPLLPCKLGSCFILRAPECADFGVGRGKGPMPKCFAGPRLTWEHPSLSVELSPVFPQGHCKSRVAPRGQLWVELFNICIFSWIAHTISLWQIFRDKFL